VTIKLRAMHCAPDKAVARAMMHPQRPRGTWFWRDVEQPISRDCSKLGDWSRRHVVAQVGYQARAICRVIAGARSGAPVQMYPSDAARIAEITLGATLPARALRSLFSHAEVHLNVEWRDLTDAEWGYFFEGRAGETLRNTAWQRTVEIWVRSVDLGAGGRFQDFPPEFLDQMLAVAQRRLTEDPATATITLLACDRAGFAPSNTAVIGRSADLARWVSGRGAQNLTYSTGVLPRVACLL
jgi:maleylpyruvate isomerase